MSLITSNEERKVRDDLCNNCESKIIVLGQRVCGECNCPLSGKVLLTLSTCKLNKWPILKV